MNTKSYAIAFGLPLDEAVRRMNASAAALNASAERMPASQEGFGERIAAAIARRKGYSFDAQPQANSEESSFAQRIAEAVRRRGNSHTRHQARTKAERSRYHPLKRRRATVSG